MTQEKTTSPEHSFGLNKIIKLKLVNTIFGGIFLIAGLSFSYFFPEQQQIGSLILAIGAITVGIPVFYSGIVGFLSKDNKFMTEQLVSLAILASMVEGNFIVAILIPVILVVGHFLEEKSILGVEEAISSMKKLHSRKTRLLAEGKETLIEPEDLKVNDKVICYPGETIPCDGVIEEGETTINQAPISGESVPITAYPGEKVFAGTINLSGKIIIKVKKLSSETLLNKITMLLAEAEKSKAPIVKIIEKYLGLYFPFVIMVSALTLFATGDLNRAITILIISCPCALILASPTAMIAALVVASRHGIMIKNTAFLEILSDISTIIFDKTGTVTYGKLEVESIAPEAQITKNELLKTAVICASGSIHPVSAAIRSYAHNIGITAHSPKKQEELPGKGVIAQFENQKYYLGKKEWILKETGLTSTTIKTSEKTSVCIANSKEILGEIFFSDRPRPEMKETIKTCRNMGISKMVLLTGDKKHIADEIGKSLEVDKTISECLPQDKLNYVNKAKEDDTKVMFIGDGINDALALKASDAGVAIGINGSDIAIQNADITLNTDNFFALPTMFKLSKRTRSIINQNILIGTGFSLFMMGIASLGLISPVWGAILHNFGSLFVVFNSARLLREK